MRPFSWLPLPGLSANHRTTIAPSKRRSPRSDRKPGTGGGAARRATHALQVPGVQPANRAHSEVGMSALTAASRSSSTLKRSADKATERCFSSSFCQRQKPCVQRDYDAGAGGCHTVETLTPRHRRLQEHGTRLDSIGNAAASLSRPGSSSLLQRRSRPIVESVQRPRRVHATIARAVVDVRIAGDVDIERGTGAAPTARALPVGALHGVSGPSLNADLVHGGHAISR